VHAAGAAAARRLEAAREQLAQALTGAEGHAREIVFTSGGTESNALGILIGSGAGGQGAVGGGGPAPARQRARHVVVSAIEHPSVLRNVERLASTGGDAACEVTVVGVGPNGLVDPRHVVEALRPDTVLVSVMHVNNELGTVQPIAEIADALKSREARTGTRRPHLHVDAVQSFGNLGLRVGGLGADSVAVSGHKIHGPRGVGALWMSMAARARARAGLAPLWDGGRQEGGLRSGTENLPAAVGLACAATLAVTALARGEGARLAALRDRFERTAFAVIPALRPTVPIGDSEAAAPPRAPHISSVFVPGVPAEPLLHALEARGVMASAGAACASRQRGPSHVLEAIGLDPRVAVLRFSLSRETTEAELDAAVVALEEAIAELDRARPRRARR
jgi:cysteine desulfurase